VQTDRQTDGQTSFVHRGADIVQGGPEKTGLFFESLKLPYMLT